MKTTVDFSVDSPYSQNLERSRLQNYIDKACYRHQVDFINKHGHPGAQLLDVGCGSGIFLKVASLNSNVSLNGLDFDHRLLGEASQRVPECNFTEGSAEELPFADKSFKFVTTFHNIEHLYHPEKFVSECKRVLDDSGYVILATPNPASYVSKKLGEKWGASPTQTPDHISLKSPQEWRSLFEQHSFNVVSEGTTFFSSLPMIKNTPLKYINHLMLYSLGNFRWEIGEAYQAVFQVSR
jgi:ubiquinone/menaquinone biosynthesis C-methylase UbiE